MTKRSIIAIPFMLALLLPFYSIAQLDGWTKGKGNMDLALSTTFEQGTGFYAGEELIDLTRTQVVASIFAARGITKDLDVILSIPYVNISGSGGFQDIAFWLKWAPIQTDLGQNWKMSLVAAGGISTPMSNYGTESVSSIGQQATVFMPMALAQFQHNRTGFFFNLSSGYHFKTEPTPDLVPFTFKAGLAKTKYYLEVYFDVGVSQGGKDYRGQGELAPDSFTEIGANWSKLGAKYYQPLNDRYGFSCEAFKTLSGRNYDNSIGLAAAFIWKIPARVKADEK